MRVQYVTALFFFLFILLPQSGFGRAARQLWIPQAIAPEDRDCRFEMEELISPVKKSSDQPGQQFSLGIGMACGLYRAGRFSIEGGLDWIESYDLRATSYFDPLQGSLQITYNGQELPRWEGESFSGFSAAIGAQGFGLKSGENDFNIFYALAQHRAQVWRITLGAYYGNSDQLVSGSGQRDHSGLLFGVWRQKGRGSIGAEWQSGQNRFGYGFFGATLNLNETSTVAAGYGFANDRKSVRDWVLIRISLR